MRRIVVIQALMLLICAQAAQAQRAAPRFALEQDSVRATRGAWTPVRIAKWSLLATAGSAAVYGFIENREADREYEAIERVCQADPNACLTAVDGGAYADAALESRYRAVLERDDRAQVALLAGQIGLAASVLLFIMDLPEGSVPEDIPYDPRKLDIGFDNRQLQLGVRLPAR